MLKIFVILKEKISDPIVNIFNISFNYLFGPKESIVIQKLHYLVLNESISIPKIDLSVNFSDILAPDINPLKRLREREYWLVDPKITRSLDTEITILEFLPPESRANLAMSCKSMSKSFFLFCTYKNLGFWSKIKTADDQELREIAKSREVLQDLKRPGMIGIWMNFFQQDLLKKQPYTDRLMELHCKNLKL